MTGREIPEEVEMTEEVVITVVVVMTEVVVMTALVEIGSAENAATPTSHFEPSAIAVMPQSLVEEMTAVVNVVVVVMSAEEAEMTEVDKIAPVEIGIALSATTPTFHFEPNAIAAMPQEEAEIVEAQEGEKEEAVAVNAVVNVGVLIKSAMIEEIETTVENVETITGARMTGPAHNAIIPTSHSEPNATAVMHPRVEAVARREEVQGAENVAAQGVATEEAQEAEIVAVQGAATEEAQEAENVAAPGVATEEAQEAENVAADKEVRVEMDGEDLLSVAHQDEFSNHGNLKMNPGIIVIERIQVTPLGTIEGGNFHG